MKRNRFAGQGLVEYALVLTLVGLVSIVILALFGPALGGVFSNVNTALSGDAVVQAVPTAASPPPTPTTAPPPAGAWVFCAHEYHTCNFPGTKNIRYGLNGHFYYQVHTDHVLCGNGVFGDPYIGFDKDCHYWDPMASP